MKKHVLLLLFLLLHGCDKPQLDSPEQQVRHVLQVIEEGFEERSLSQVVDNIDDDYSDYHGRNKLDIKRYVQLQILRNQNITIFSTIHSIDIDGALASVELSAATAARGVNLDIEENRLKADSHKASIVLKYESGEWRIISSSWQRGW